MEITEVIRRLPELFKFLFFWWFLIPSIATALFIAAWKWADSL